MNVYQVLVYMMARALMTSTNITASVYRNGKGPIVS